MGFAGRCSDLWGRLGCFADNETFGIGRVCQVGELQSDERIVFYPTFGWRATRASETNAGQIMGAGGHSGWLLDIHGIVFRPEFTSRKRDLAVRMARSLMPRNDSSVDQTLFRRRFWSFLVDNKGDRSVSVRIGGEKFKVGLSAADGHFRSAVRVSAELVASLMADKAVRPATAGTNAVGWLPFEAVTPASCERQYRGCVTLIEPEGVSVISDIDDTIKVSDVVDKSRLVTNVLARRYHPVDGMPELYRRWADQGAAFHYVSASPWQLYRPLLRFFRQVGFPEGTFHLKKWRLAEPSTLELFHTSVDLKLDAIRRILTAFPHRRFILVGDSTQKDPEVYGQILLESPAQVDRVLIRNVRGAEMSADRITAVFRDVPSDRWQLFDEPAEISGR